MLAADVAWYLPTDLLVKMDIATMAHSLESRSPFLDWRLTEFVATLPSDYKLRGRTSKYLLKKAVADLVPADNMHRPKQGFAVPIGAWFRGELKDFLADHVLSDRFRARGLFRPDAVRRIFDDHQRGARDHAHHLWVLLMLELWFRGVHRPDRGVLTMTRDAATSSASRRSTGTSSGRATRKSCRAWRRAVIACCSSRTPACGRCAGRICRG